MIRLLGVVMALWLALASSGARADDNRPLTVTIRQDDGPRYRVTWKVPANVEARHVPSLTPPSSCSVALRAREWSDPLGHWREELWQCPRGLGGTRIAIAYPFANPNLATIARIHTDAGGEQTLLLQPHETTLALPSRADTESDFLKFLRLGFEHIWLGIDHLLFVAGLIFIARTPRRVLATVTGFTLAHSLTLALAATDIVRLPSRAVETIIALSIAFLAVEIVKGPRDTLTWRRPIWVAGSFGLLHGFGFAAVLRDVGLPEAGFAEALLAFNLGIEAGQIVFASLILVLLSLIHRLPSETHAGRLITKAGGYAIGILASNWMIARLLAA